MEKVAPSWSKITQNPKRAVENKPSFKPRSMESLSGLGLSLHTFILATQDLRPQPVSDVQVLPFIYPDIQEERIAEEKGKEQIPLQEMNHKNEVWEEQLQAMQKANMFGSSDAFNSCLMSNLILPPKLKVPNFTMFSGSECPLAHLGMYLQKMVAHCGDDDMLIQYFQDSLTGEALRWYNRVKIRTWEDLTRAFIAQYNNDIASDKQTLRNVEKKASKYSHDQEEMTTQSYPRVEKGKTVCLCDGFVKDQGVDNQIRGISQNLAYLRITRKQVKEAFKIKGVQYTRPRQSSSKGVEKKERKVGK
ncbi:uncharacterized protein LOC131158720 [Malania oleifera]|uniref:uncharacterized protein LOC131158720 n=1 Tax=Malania oleifera TaxID=397392 RepID=UPI0025AE63F5|nr:uncharacterized protein LOC131158720 [Malania oleifera]